MTKFTKILFALPLVVFTQAILAKDELQVSQIEQNTQTIEMESANISALRLKDVENEANENANEIHQESTVGRAGLQGLCKCPPICPLKPPSDFDSE